MDNLQKQVYSTITDKKLTYRQKRHSLAYIAEGLLTGPEVSNKTLSLMEKGILHDMDEGPAPYRPRYVVPDYSKFFCRGSQFLELNPPQNIYDALQSLLVLYGYVPSITGYPVYLGNVDQLLQPFIDEVDTETAYSMIKWFLISVDRMMPDSFVHLNIGPEYTGVGEMILKAEMKLKQPVPNISLKFDPDYTSEPFTLLAVKTALTTGKPYFNNHRMIEEDLGNYAVVSCYNNLVIGGGSHTLVRINMKKLAEEKDVTFRQFMDDMIPEAVEAAVELANARARFLVEEAGFFDSCFLAGEGLISLDKFTSMVGVYGIGEAVNLFARKEGIAGRYGHHAEANLLALEIVRKLREEIDSSRGYCCGGTGNKPTLHAQSGISTDIHESPGARIPIGDEPELLDHILTVAPLHRYFNSGISDIFIFDQTARGNPEGVLQIVKGALKKGIRTFALNSRDSDLVRVTGYLVKKSDLERLKAAGQVRHVSTELGLEAAQNQRILERRTRTPHAGEQDNTN